jgi:hypothetical protein
MCLDYSKEATDTVRKMFQGKKYIFVYKEVRLGYSVDRLLALKPRLVSVSYWYDWMLGENVSDRKWGISQKNEVTKLETREKESCQVSQGFHVWIKKPRSTFVNRVIVRLKAKLRDFVAASLNGEAVFDKLTLSKKQHNRALKELLQSQAIDKINADKTSGNND